MDPSFLLCFMVWSVGPSGVRAAEALEVGGRLARHGRARVAGEWERSPVMANVLTAMRILLIPVFLILVLGEPVPGAQAWGLAVLALSAATDVADGWVARRRGEVSRFGTLMDPLADKLTLVAVVLALAWQGRAPWWVAFVLLGKETVQVVGAAWLWRRRERVVAARWPGKGATVALYLGAVLVLLGWGPGVAVLVGGVLLSLAAGLYYLVLALRDGKPSTFGPA